MQTSFNHIHCCYLWVSKSGGKIHWCGCRQISLCIMVCDLLMSWDKWIAFWSNALSLTLPCSGQEEEEKTSHKFPRTVYNTSPVPQERSFSQLMTPLTLISAWEEMKVLKVWCWSNLSDFIVQLTGILLLFCFSELTCLYLISIYKSIWGFVFILVCWECSKKCESIIHNGLNWDWPMTDAPFVVCGLVLLKRKKKTCFREKIRRCFVKTK